MFQAPRGVADRLPADQKYWRYIESTAVALAQSYGFQRIDSPVFEDAGLFIRTVGPGTDIVEKEMYTFEERGGAQVTLRPEGTAPVCRAYLEHGMHNLPQPVRLYYFCPVFRYERPQAGRYRQHHQFGIEVIGDANPTVDAEVIELAWRLLHALGLTQVQLLVNSIGDQESRPGYVALLEDYYGRHTATLCADCRNRLARNPLRLLDCKKPDCHALGRDAPRSVEHLTPDSRQHWEQLQDYLTAMDLPFQVDHRLVRGLDYYSRTVFELQPLDAGGQSTICGGGRYDGLMEELGGRPTPGIGFGMGLERLILNLKRAEIAVPELPGPQYLVANVGDAARRPALELASRIRKAGAGAMLSSGGRALRGQLRQANALGIPCVLILGDDEISRGEVVIRDMQTSQQETRPLSDFLAGLTVAAE